MSDRLNLLHRHAKRLPLLALTVATLLATAYSTPAQRGRRGRGNAEPDRLVWVNRDGSRGETIGSAHRIITGPTISPDGKMLAVREGDGNDDIFVYNLADGTRIRITTDEASDMHPQWTADGTRVAFFTYRNGLADIYIKVVDGDDPETPLANGPFHEYHPDFTPDGKSVVYHHHDPESDTRDIWTKPLAGGDAVRVVSAEGSEGMPRLSKDGSYMTYQSNESGEYEVYVVAYPSGEGKVKVSSGGGNWPKWSNDELFFFSNNTLMAVPVTTDGSTIELGVAEALFTTEDVGMRNTRSSQFNAKYEVSADGQRFLIVVK
jgi:Tol biopolymer transport system component